MEKNILLRFQENDSLNILIEETAKKLGLTKAALTRIALFNYCQALNGGKDGAK